jgi:hypothetical protein
MEWRSASKCSGNVQCVEVAFHKSSFSLPNKECVEVAETADRVLVRDSKDPEGAELVFTRGEWDAFVKGVKSGEFDLQ